MANLNLDNLINVLLEELPEFKDIYQEDRDYYGEDFLYLLFGAELVSFTLHNYETYLESREASAESERILRKILNFIEYCIASGDEDVIELIRTGYMEGFDTKSDSYQPLQSLMGPLSKNLLIRVKGK